MFLDRRTSGEFRFDGETSGFLTGNRDFPNFIGFLSNPLQSIDPRAQTILFPMFGAAWASDKSPRLPSADMQVYGAGLWVAASERLSFGANQGGYAVVDVAPHRERLLARLGLPVPERDRAGQREGWLNLGGFLQYTLIADVENQFILTAGMRLEVPSGATQVFQGGDNPPYMAPYLTAGKECGFWHVLATSGYEFPLGSGVATTNCFYLNLHLDRQIGWLYPLVEFNGCYHASEVDLRLPLRHRVLDLGTFSSSGNLLTVAVGANAVLIPGGSSSAPSTPARSPARTASTSTACWSRWSIVSEARVRQLIRDKTPALFSVVGLLHPDQQHLLRAICAEVDQHRRLLLGQIVDAGFKDTVLLLADRPRGPL